MRLRSALVFLGTLVPSSAFACGNALIEAGQMSALSEAQYPLIAVVIALSAMHRLTRVHLGLLPQLSVIASALVLFLLGGALMGYALTPHPLELMGVGVFGLPLSLAFIRVLGGPRRSRAPF